MAKGIRNTTKGHKDKNSDTNHKDVSIYAISNEGYEGRTFEKCQHRNGIQVNEDQLAADDVNSNVAATTKQQVSQSRKIIVLMACFFSVTLCGGTAFNLSVLNNEWLEYFQKSSAETSLIQSIAMAMLNIGGFPSGMIVAKIGTRKVGVVGGCLSALGLCLSFVATDVFFLVMTIGVISGLGFSLILNASFTSVSRYYTGKQLMMALSFASFGSGVGGMCIPVLLQFGIDNFGWKGSILVLGGIALNLPVCGMIYKDVKLPNIKTSSNKNHDVRLAECVKELVTNGLYMSFVCAMGLVISTLGVFSIFIVDYLESIGMTRGEAVNIYFSFTATTTVFRLLPGFLKQIPVFRVSVFVVFMASLGCTALALLPLFSTRLLLSILVCCFGASVGGLITVNALIVLKLIKHEHYSTAIGINATVSGISSLSAGPIAGYFRDISGSYSLTFFTASATLGAATIIFTTMLITKSRKDRRKTGRRSDSSDEFEIVITGYEHGPIFMEQFS